MMPKGFPWCVVCRCPAFARMCSSTRVAASSSSALAVARGSSMTSCGVTPARRRITAAYSQAMLGNRRLIRESRTSGYTVLRCSPIVLTGLTTQVEPSPFCCRPPRDLHRLTVHCLDRERAPVWSPDFFEGGLKLRIPDLNQARHLSWLGRKLEVGQVSPPGVGGQHSKQPLQRVDVEHLRIVLRSAGVSRNARSARAARNGSGSGIAFGSTIKLLSHAASRNTVARIGSKARCMRLSPVGVQAHCRSGTAGTLSLRVARASGVQGTGCHHRRKTVQGLAPRP